MVEVPHDLITSSASNVQSPKEETTLVTVEPGNNGHSDTVVFEDSAPAKCTQMDYNTNIDSKSVRIDISFKSPSHTGLQTTELVIFWALFVVIRVSTSSSAIDLINMGFIKYGSTD